MDILKKRIVEQGRVISSQILKVDGFLNHQIDTLLMYEIGPEVARRFTGCRVTKILTVEASGIPAAVMAGFHLRVPVVFAKKRSPSTISEQVYTAECVSFTKGSSYRMTVSAEFIGKGDIVLIVDDFLAHGNAASALIEIAESAGATVCGVSSVIEKAFQKGGDMLRSRGYRVDSLSIIDSIGAEGIVFKD